MDESRRARKKRQTRRLLAETAIRLFAEQGYEQTTVAQIAAAADVATKTFFNHFPSKDDVLFADTLYSNAIPHDVIAGRRPGETIPELLPRVFEALLADYRAEGVGQRDPALMATYTHLVMTVPALQARALHMAFDLQKEISAALLAAYPDELDPISASAVVGAMVGAAQAAALRTMDLGRPPEEVWAAMRRAIAIAMHGLPAR